MSSPPPFGLSTRAGPRSLDSDLRFATAEARGDHQTKREKFEKEGKLLCPHWYVSKRVLSAFTTDRARSIVVIGMLLSRTSTATGACPRLRQGRRRRRRSVCVSLSLDRAQGCSSDLKANVNVTTDSRVYDRFTNLHPWT